MTRRTRRTRSPAAAPTKIVGGRAGLRVLRVLRALRVKKEQRSSARVKLIPLGSESCSALVVTPSSSGGRTPLRPYPHPLGPYCLRVWSIAIITGRAVSCLACRSQLRPCRLRVWLAALSFGHAASVSWPPASASAVPSPSVEWRRQLRPCRLHLLACGHQLRP